MTKQEAHVEYRAVADQPFMSPQRDLLRVYHEIMRATGKIVVNGTDQDILTDDEAEELAGVLASVWGASMEKTDVEDILKKFHEDLSKFNPIVYAGVIKGMADNLTRSYVHHNRCSVEKPELTGDQVITTMSSLGILDLMDEEDQKKWRKRALISGLLERGFAEATGVFEKREVTPEELAERSKKEESKEAPKHGWMSTVIIPDDLKDRGKYEKPRYALVVDGELKDDVHIIDDDGNDLFPRISFDGARTLVLLTEKDAEWIREKERLTFSRYVREPRKFTPIVENKREVRRKDIIEKDGEYWIVLGVGNVDIVTLNDREGLTVRPLVFRKDEDNYCLLSKGDVKWIEEQGVVDLKWWMMGEVL